MIFIVQIKILIMFFEVVVEFGFLNDTVNGFHGSVEVWYFNILIISSFRILIGDGFFDDHYSTIFKTIIKFI